MDDKGIHPAPAEFTPGELETDQILRFFHYAHLPPQLQPTSRNYALLARWIVSTVPRGPERTVALRKLLESKDAAVRANLPVKREHRESEPEIGEPREIGGHDVGEEALDFNR